MNGRGKAIATVLVLFGTAFCGKDSNTVTGPASTVPMASVAGTWSGNYTSNDRSCPATPMTITLSQNGTAVTGAWSTNNCGPHGTFKATMAGDTLSGNIDMIGCTGGAVMGHVSASALSISIGDFYRPIVTANQVLMEGGEATLSR